MKDRIQEQVSHERDDRFKSHVVFPIVANELRKIRTVDGLRTLHIGEGSGQIASYLKEVSIKEAVLVDVNQDILTVARKNFREQGIKAQTIYQSARDLLPIEKNSIDAIIALFSLNQIQNPQIVFDLATHYLSTGGRFIVVVPDEAYIAGPVKERAGKTTEKIEGVLDRKRTKYYLGQEDFNVEFYARPNTDYQNWFGEAGFIVGETSRLIDPFEPAFPTTPKAVMFIGGKAPTKLGSEESLVETTVDEVYEGKLRMAQVSEGVPYAKLTLQLPQKKIRDIPFPLEANLEELLDIVYSKIKEITVRHLVTKSSANGATKHIYRLFYKGDRLAFYSFDLSSHNVDTISIFGVK